MRKRAYILMTAIVFMWGYEYVAAKHALESLEPIVLVFLKYLIALLCLILFKLKIDGTSFIIKKDVPYYIICAIFGEIVYFWAEYTAMDYIPIALITIILAFVPVASVITEKLIYKVRANAKIYMGIFFCIIGISFVVGADFSVLFSGRIIGYLLSLVAVLSWNAYNFVTRKLTGNFTELTLTVNQLIMTVIISAPFAIAKRPPLTAFTPQVVGGIMYLGIISAALGFLMYIFALKILGPTPTALFSNFLPITAALFGWVSLHEVILPLQILGGILVIIAGSFVIREKGRLEDQRLCKK
ncbi:MAG: DMT family transporter [Clostridiales bacterium]|nr:DMT family transporter [Clostridiales bacterium]